MYCLDYSERPKPDNLQYFMLHELVLLGIIRRSFPIRTHSLRIHTVVKLYNHTLRLRYGRIPIQYSPVSRCCIFE